MNKLKYFRWSIKFQMAAVLAIALFCVFVLGPVSEYLQMRSMERFWLNAGGFISKDQAGGYELVGISKHFDTEQLSELERVPELQCLCLMESKISNEELTSICNMNLPKLTRLVLNDTKITDHGLVNIHKLSHLKSLHLRNTPITDKSVVALVELVNLSRLDVRGTNISRAGLDELKAKLPDTIICCTRPTT